VTIVTARAALARLRPNPFPCNEEDTP
jgi:hypothetical protein